MRVNDVTLPSFSFKNIEAVPLVELKYLVFTRMPGESYRRRLRSLLLYYFVFCISSANELPCVLILYEHSGPLAFMLLYVHGGEMAY